MKITIEENVKIKKDVELNFPIYRKLWLDDSTWYMKVESVDRQVNIHIYDSEMEAEIEIRKPSFWGSRDYLLGEGKHKSSKDEFDNALIELNKLVSSVG